MFQVLKTGILLGLAALLASGCSAPASAGIETRDGAPSLSVVATTSIVADLVQNIGGERVSVESLMGPGVDPHLYRASAGDVRRLENADVIFYNGLHLEAGMAIVLERMGEVHQTIAVTRNIDRDQLMAPPEYEGSYDPHIWFDVTLWMQAAETVRDALIEVDPEGADFYQQSTVEYLAALDDLHGYVQEQVNRVAEEKRVLITAHDAFNYFGRAYGFEVRGLQGISTASEVGAGDMQDLASFIAERQIPAIFIESSVPQRNIEAVQAAVRSRGFDVAIGGELFSDALGSSGTPEATYIGIVRHNVDTIVGGLADAGD
jgi:manganese/zinc/iron transport system substrate-binding protein